MLKFEAKVLHTKDLVEATLENGERIIFTLSGWEEQQEELAEPMEVKSVDGNKYLTVLSEIEYSDETPEIIGFEKA